MTTTIARIMPVAMLLSSDPIVWARCWRRSPAPGLRSASNSPALVLAMMPGTVPLLARETSRSIDRQTNQRNISPRR